MTDESDLAPPRRSEYLIVDDEPDICWSLKNILRLRGLRSQTARCATEALALVKLQRFDLAFLDVTLPDMNGLELAGHLRRVDPEMRLVIVSGYLSADQAALIRAHDAQPFHGCIIKPFLHEDILRLIDSNNRNCV